MSLSNLAEFEKILGYEFKEKLLLTEALTHSTYNHENSFSHSSNERLELLGDSVLHLILTEYLINNYPNDNEGSLSAIRSYCENEDFLNKVSLKLDIGRYLLLGKGEASDGGNKKKSILADAFEAVLGAIYQDGGYQAAQKLVMREFVGFISEAYDNYLYADAKSELQKYTQKYSNSLPSYTVLKEEGLEHDKIFTIVVEFIDKYGKKQKFEAEGKNIKLAQKNAAAKALKLILNMDTNPNEKKI